ncbi:hypothetical protein LCGC14_2872320 [marine sediment metagenome]|uniref:NADAR domain-containing protein n=1 Tax=marine sediment metagenome TaxID=412755 RepID=A0A0F9AAR0_9ZZZZ
MVEVISSFRGEYWFLSNFCPCDIEWDRLRYRSVEHAFQAAKTFDNDRREEIQEARTPGEAKRLGRQVKLIENWEEIKDEIMYTLIHKKFESESLRAKLLNTGDIELIEGNNWGDTYWGVCSGIGQNKLGRILMEVRKEIERI